MEFHHGPLSNKWFLTSIFGIIVSGYLWISIFSNELYANMSQWAFLLTVVSIIAFVATFVSATRAPLLIANDGELAVHEKYRNKRYPNTTLHKGLVPEEKVHLHKRKKLIMPAKKKPVKKSKK